MSDINIPPFYNAPTAQQRQAQSTASGTNASRTTQSQRSSSGDPTDIITTSPAADALLGTLNSQLSLSDAQSQKDFDAKQLKAAIQQLHILQLLGIGLGPEELAKQTTALAKQIAGIAKDYADNSGTSPTAAGSTSQATASATSAANTAAAQATSAASTANPAAAGADQASQTAKAAADKAAQSAKTQADQASQTAKTSADKATQSAQSIAETATSTSGIADASASSSTASSTSQGTATAPDQAAADNPDDFFGEVVGAFKDLKKLESRAVSQLNLSPDKQKKKEAKKLGGEFNDAVQSVTQSANAAGATGAASQLAGQSIDLSKITLNLSA